MKKPTMVKKVCMAVVVSAISILLSGCGTVGVQSQIKAEVVMTSGDTVQLFYDGNQEAKNMFCLGETVSVYAASTQQQPKSIEVGKVRIVRAIDQHHLEGIVVEGKLKEGDIARKAIAACKIMPRLPGRE